MTIQKTTTDLSTLKINYLTQEMYEDALENDEINENELYITPGSGGGASAFIAEFNVTTFAEVLTEYNAGKTLICKYTDLAVFYAPLGSVSLSNGSVEGFAFSVGGYGSSISFLLSSSGWTLSEMSATSTPTANKLPLFDSSAKMNSTDMTSQEVSDFVGNLGYSFNLIDMFYPVGSYYETSDSSFNPNVAWGGTWVLETEGQVHVSAGANYDVGDTGGSKYIQAHTHGFTQPAYTVSGGAVTGGVPSTNSGHTHTLSNASGVWMNSSGTKNIASGSSATRTTNTISVNSSGAHTHNLPSHSHTVTRSTDGAVGAVSGATTGNEDNMQPYIVVNRWHRTA